MPEKGFFPSLFDIGFTSWITPRVIKVLYVLGMVGIALFLVIIIIASFANDPASGIFVLLIVAPLGGLLWLIFWRMYLEGILVLFRIMEHTGAMAAQSGAMPAGGPPAPTPGFAGPPSPGALGAAPPPTAPARPEAAPAAPAAPPAGGGPGQPAGWYPDPQGRARVRYWDGSTWTDHTSD
jgi:hypothetical protein